MQQYSIVMCIKVINGCTGRNGLTQVFEILIKNAMCFYVPEDAYGNVIVSKIFFLLIFKTLTLPKYILHLKIKNNCNSTNTVGKSDKFQIR